MSWIEQRAPRKIALTLALRYRCCDDQHWGLTMAQMGFFDLSAGQSTA